MDTQNAIDRDDTNFFKHNVLGHPAGLFVIFFTEMWERFSFYGMRAIFVLFLTSDLVNGGWGWDKATALTLYGTYTSMVYLSPLIGGYFADNYFGSRKSVLIGAFIMALGHASMALEIPLFMYVGLGCLIVGNGFFKPNMVSIVSELYKDNVQKKDPAYTIFYMGVNSGSFFGMMLCGYLGENIGWSYGFGLAGIFMILGLIMFYKYQGIFGDIGIKPRSDESLKSNIDDGDKRNPFNTLDKAMAIIAGLIALVWIINDPVSKLTAYNAFGTRQAADYVMLGGIIVFVLLLFIRIFRYSTVTRDRMLAVVIIAFFYMLFWAAFEQAGGSMTLFAKDYVNRQLVGSAATIFKISNALLTIIPLGIITWVLFQLLKRTFSQYQQAASVLAVSFAAIWVIVLWMLYRYYMDDAAEVGASWFQVLNSFFIITLAPLVSRIWDSKYNPPPAVKYTMGMIFLGLGFYALSYGAGAIPFGAAAAKVSMMYLVVAYFFHTLGELCISPVGLSYVSKLVPARMIASMYGIWYLAIAIGNKIAGKSGSMMDEISKESGLSYFFWLFTIIPFIAAVLIFVIQPVLKRLMHGVK